MRKGEGGVVLFCGSILMEVRVKMKHGCVSRALVS